MAGVSQSKRIWGWWWFDWATQPYHTLLMTFTYGPFFATVAAAYFIGQGLGEDAADAQAQALWSLTLTITGLIIGFGAPIIGAMADISGRRRPWILGFSIMYAAGSAALWYTMPDGSNMWAMLCAFGIGFIGAEFAAIFVNSQLPGLVEDGEVGKVSGSGFAFGYLGGIIALAIMLVFFMEQEGGKTLVGLSPAFGLLDAGAREGTRFVGPFTAMWFVVFMIPYALWVHDLGPRTKSTFADAMRMLGGTLRNVVKKRSTMAYLFSSMFYRDALNGLYGFGGVYATLVLDWSITQVGIFGIVAALSAAGFSWAGGKLDSRIGPKPVIVGAIWVLIGVIFVIIFMSREGLFGIPFAEGSIAPDVIFYICGMALGGMGGTLQSASRTLMVRHTDPKAPTEAFGLYGLSGRATAFMAPALIGIVTTWSGSARIGVSPLLGLFVIGLVLLLWVKPEGEEA